MPAAIEVENISKSIGELQLFKQIGFTIQQGNKTALVAKNGEGKTTLLNILTGIDGPDQGEVKILQNLKFAYLKQEPELIANYSVLDAVFHQDNKISKLVKDYELAIAKENSDDMENLIIKMDNANAWDFENRAKLILTQLGITNFNQKIRELSGGQKKRVALAQVLIAEPEILLLDEPTNHLDIKSIEWLEDYLKKTNLTLLMVTHDRYFIDRVCNEIIELDNNQIYTYKGNYSYFLKKKAQRISEENVEIEKAKNLLRTEEEWMRRMPKARGSKAKYRIDEYYKLKDLASSGRNNEEIRINIKERRLGSKILIAKNLYFNWDNTPYINDFNYTFSRFEKVGILGANGTGKSTLLDLLTGKLNPDKGSIETGETIKFGYYRQEGISFDENSRVIDAVSEIAETVKVSDNKVVSSSQFLNYFLFPPNRQHDFIYKLSGGEKRRLYLCTVLMKNPNFLILDEPTNDIDIATLEILEGYLQSFNGCVIVVSHDRSFMDSVVDHLFIFEGDGVIKDFPGNYSQYFEWKQNLKKPPPENKFSAKSSKKKSEKASKKLSYNEKREFEQLESEISNLEKEKNQLELELNTSSSNHEDLIKISQRIGDIINELDVKTNRWMELAEKIEE